MRLSDSKTGRYPHHGRNPVTGSSPPISHRQLPFRCSIAQAVYAAHKWAAARSGFLRSPFFTGETVPRTVSCPAQVPENTVLAPESLVLPHKLAIFGQHYIRVTMCRHPLVQRRLTNTQVVSNPLPRKPICQCNSHRVLTKFFRSSVLPLPMSDLLCFILRYQRSGTKPRQIQRVSRRKMSARRRCSSVWGLDKDTCSGDPRRPWRIELSETGEYHIKGTANLIIGSGKISDRPQSTPEPGRGRCRSGHENGSQTGTARTRVIKITASHAKYLIG